VPATRAFPAPCPHDVSLCLNVDEATQKQTIVVRNRPPRAAFSFSPRTPLVGQAITVNSTSVDLDGPIVRYGWDLDGDGAFDDGGAISASVLFGSAGVPRGGVWGVDPDGGRARPPPANP